MMCAWSVSRSITRRGTRRGTSVLARLPVVARWHDRVLLRIGTGGAAAIARAADGRSDHGNDRPGVADRRWRDTDLWPGRALHQHAGGRHAAVPRADHAAAGAD